MNTTILKKCIEELGKDTPDISYIRGALETLVELSNPTSIVPPILTRSASSEPAYKVTTPQDEELSPEAQRYLNSTRVGAIN
jgi:hypothetical protein